MISLPFGLFLLGLFNLVPFISWLLTVTAIPEQKYGGSNKPLRISVAFQQLFVGRTNPISWAVIMSLITGIACFVYSAILAADKAIDFILAIILVIIVITSLIAFVNDVNYMKTDMYAGALQRTGEFFKIGDYRYLAWIPILLIFGFSVIGTMLSSVTFLYLAYYLITRQPIYFQIAGKRRH